MVMFLPGIAAGSFAKALDLKDIYHNIVKMQTEAKIRRLSQVKPGDAVGSASPQAEVDPRHALASFGITGKQAQSLIDKGPQAVQAAIDKAPMPKGLDARPTFYADPETGQLGATTHPVYADSTYTAAHIASIYMHSGDPALVDKGVAMTAQVQAQKANELKINQLQRQDSINRILSESATDPSKAVQDAANELNSDNKNVLNGNKYQANYDPKSGTVTMNLVAPDGKVVQPGTPTPFRGSADGTQPGFMDQVAASADSSTYLQHQQAIAAAVSNRSRDQAMLMSAHASMAQAGAAEESAQANVARAKAQIPEDQARAQVLGEAAQQTALQNEANKNRAQAVGFISDNSKPLAARLNQAGILQSATPGQSPWVKFNPNTMRYGLLDPLTNAPLGYRDMKGNYVPDAQYQPTIRALAKQGHNVQLQVGKYGPGYYDTRTGAWINMAAAGQALAGGGAPPPPSAPAAPGAMGGGYASAPSPPPPHMQAPPVSLPRSAFGMPHPAAAPAPAPAPAPAAAQPGAQAHAGMPPYMMPPNIINGAHPMLNGSGIYYGGGAGPLASPLNTPAGMSALYSGG